VCLELRPRAGRDHRPPRSAVLAARLAPGDIAPVAMGSIPLLDPHLTSPVLREPPLRAESVPDWWSLKGPPAWGAEFRRTTHTQGGRRRLTHGQSIAAPLSAEALASTSLSTVPGRGVAEGTRPVGFLRTMRPSCGLPRMLGRPSWRPRRCGIIPRCRRLRWQGARTMRTAARSSAAEASP
jgi:hypothetical protein